MTFIRVQNAKKDTSGNIVGGSASIVESEYKPTGKNHCKQVLRESLGTIIFMDSRKSGIFLSKTRGLVRYDAELNEFEKVDKNDPRLKASGEAFDPCVRTFFGDSDIVLRLMRDEGLLRIFRNMAAGNDALFAKIICHTLYGVLRDGSKMNCDRFIERSFVSNIIPFPVSVLRTDTKYFDYLGNFEVRLEFFKRFVQEMRRSIPLFGKGCYVDSTPLPNSITDLPTNRNCSHGLDSVGIQTRLVFVLDIRTGLPVWFETIPGNVLDLNTIMNVTDKLSRLIDVHIEDMVLDAGYVCKNVINAYNLDDNRDKTLIARMPAKKGYNHDKLFVSTYRMFSNAKYGFVRQNHSYFGFRKEVVLFDKREYAYVYVDFENASSYYREFLYKKTEEYEKMNMREKNRTRYRGGFFVLVSNIDTTPEKLLDLYFGRTEIETVLNCGKEYIGMLPLNKHNETTVNGKLMQDIVSIIVYLLIRKLTIPTGRSISDYICDLQSLDCYRKEDDVLIVNPPNRQAKEAYALFGSKLPNTISLKDYKETMLFTV